MLRSIVSHLPRPPFAAYLRPTRLQRRLHLVVAHKHASSITTSLLQHHRHRRIQSTGLLPHSGQSCNASTSRPSASASSANDDDDGNGDDLDLDGNNASGDPALETPDDTIADDLLPSDTDLAALNVDGTSALPRELLNSTSAEQIFAFINGAATTELSIAQTIRCVLMLWEQHKNDKQRRAVHQPPAPPATYEPLLRRVRSLCASMSADELTVCLLYVNKLGWPGREATMQLLLAECQTRLKDPHSMFPLSALSRFAAACNTFRDIYTYFVCADAFGRMLQYIETVSSSEELRLLTIGLNSLHQLIGIDTLDAYKNRVRQILLSPPNAAAAAAAATDDDDRERATLKVVQFLNYPHWSQRNTQLLRELVLLLRDRIATFEVNELEQVFRVFQSQLEPAELTTVLMSRAQTLFERTPTAELLACSVMYALPDKRARLTEYAREFIYAKEPAGPAPNASATLATLFKVLRYLKISNVYICDGYWSKVLHEIRTSASERQSYVLARHCHRYMHFNNNLGGTYHHREFERHVTGLIVEEMRTGITAHIPAKFAKVAAFIIAYGHTPNGRQQLPEFVVGRIEALGGQFKVVDCLQISRGIQIALQMRFKKYVSPELSDQLRRIELVLNACTERHLAQPNLTLAQLNSILRAYNNRQTSPKTPLFHQIMNAYATIPNKLNSRAIREITFNLTASKYVMPSVCASLVQYVIDNRDYVMGDTVEKVLYCCYNLGYIPDGDAVLDAALHIVNRDFDYMSGLSIVQACLALNFYRTLPEALINRVFNIEFIRRLEDEIEMCYSKATYPERVLNQVMQLNRAVCLDCPAAGVPWFQQNYIEAQMSKLPVIRNNFNEDIKSMLIAYLKDHQLLKVDHVTPYGYRIDFVLHFDKNRKPVPTPPEIDTINDGLDKVAILLLKRDAFCQNDHRQVRGPQILRERHLEMLGYKVVQVSHSEWNAMYMNVPGAKMDYLKGLLEIE